jgi:hypothetical protein
MESHAGLPRPAQARVRRVKGTRKMQKTPHHPEVLRAIQAVTRRKIKKYAGGRGRTLPQALNRKHAVESKTINWFLCIVF